MDKRHIAKTTTNRLRMLHALKLYHNRIKARLDYLHVMNENVPGSGGTPPQDQIEWFEKEATDTIIQINQLKAKLNTSIDQQHKEMLNQVLITI